MLIAVRRSRVVLLSVALLVALLPLEAERAEAAAFPGGNGLIVYTNGAAQVPGQPPVNRDMWVMGADGSNKRTLITSSVPEVSPEYNQDGTKLIYYRDDPCSGSSCAEDELYYANADGTGVLRLTTNNGSESHPTWTPDDRIVFASDRASGLCIQGGNNDLWISDPVVGVPGTQLTSTPQHENLPSVSPDGTKVVYQRTDSCTTGTNPEVWVMNIDGTGQTRLAAGNAPSWSPDGRKVVFTSSGAVTVMNADGTGATSLTTGSLPAWSPDGTKILFNSNKGGNFDIYVIGADGTGETQLTTDPLDDLSPNWQPIPGGGPDPDPIEGTDGDDTIEGTAGDDVIMGGAGDDTIIGGGGNDTIYGGDGNDVIYGDEGPVSGTIAAFAADGGDDILDGGSGNDLVFGQGGLDKLLGAGGRDKLRGGDDKDSLKGGGGKDVLDGERGADVMNGGPGTDTCYFDSKSDRMKSCERRAHRRAHTYATIESDDRKRRARR